MWAKGYSVMRSRVPAQPTSEVADARPRPAAPQHVAVQKPRAHVIAQQARPSPAGVSQGAAARPATNPGRIHLLGIDERSMGDDPVLASLFQAMRASAGLSPADLVRLLHTRPEVLASLEAGRVRALPPMAETVRLIKDYGALLQVDVEPVLARIKQQTGEKAPPLKAVSVTARSRLVGAMQVVAQPFRRRQDAQSPLLKAKPATAPTAPVVASRGGVQHLAPAEAPQGRAAARPTVAMEPASKPSSSKAAYRQRRRRQRLLVTAGISATLLMGAVWTAQSQPSVLYAAVDQMPSGIAKSLRRGIEMIAWRLSSSRDGLTWIETSEPRRRKGDKLPVAGQAR